MKHTNVIRTALFTSLLVGGAVASRAETIAQGVASTTGAATPGTATAGTIDSAYVTGIFGTNAYVQDSTGGIYVYQGSKAGNPLNGLTVGTLLTTLGNGSFQYYATGTQFEYATANASTFFTLASSSPGNISNIPSSYYTTVTTAQLNSAMDQGSATAQGIQNQLVTLNNVTITATGTASQATFTSGGTYTLTDTAGTATLYINAASGLVGSTVPAAATKVSGVFQDYKGGSEVIPRATSDVAGSVAAAVPEPSSEAMLGAGGLALAALAVGRARRHS